jgi:hypothetical protein
MLDSMERLSNAVITLTVKTSPNDAAKRVATLILLKFTATSLVIFLRHIGTFRYHL